MMQNSNQAADGEIRPLTGVRGIAASVIVLFHFFQSWRLLCPRLTWLEPSASRGALGVDLFFILSGFILNYVYNAGHSTLRIGDYGRFVWFRLARIAPNHFVTLFFLVAAVLAGRAAGVAIQGDYPLAALPYEVTLTHAWPGIYDGSLNWNYPSWSISAEWFAYLFIFPLTWHFLRRKWRTGTLMAIAYGTLAIWLVSAGHAPVSCQIVLKVSCEFVAGGMLCGIYSQSPGVTAWAQKWNTWCGMVLLVLFAGSPIWFPAASSIIVLLFPLLLLGLTSQRSLLGKMLSTPAALWLGRISYALYMSHALTEKFLKVALPSKKFAGSAPSIKLVVLFANWSLILMAAAALYYFVEIPARNGLRRLFQWWTRRRREHAVLA